MTSYPRRARRIRYPTRTAARHPGAGADRSHDGARDGPLMAQQVLRQATSGFGALHTATPLTCADFVRRGWLTATFARAKGC